MNNIKTFSFWQLIEKYQIEIPIIQRDYAQGRKDPKSTEIRNKFLDDLLECIITEKPIELDFVFGILEENGLPPINQHHKQNTLFLPIDGQQRLTTLFLLHWYISQRANASYDFSKVCFTYETRVSSRDFCAALIKNKIEFGNLIIGDNSKETLSDSIQDNFWFVRTWKNDPTVKSVLHFIDVMHIKFEEKKNEINFSKVWDNLKQPNNYFDKVSMQPLISFKFLDLNEFKLSEELYLKMNARGRALSDFENFKAWFIGHVELLLKDKTDTERVKNKYFTNEYENNWQYLFDNNWTNWIWTNCFSENLLESTLFDRACINFIKNISFINYFVNNKDPNIKIYKEYLKNKETIFKGSIYSVCYKHIDNVTFLFDSLNILSVKFKNIKNELFFPEFWEDDNQKFIKSIFEDSDFPQTTLLYAIIKFYEDDHERNGFEDWFRVVRNLVENSIINAENFKNILGSVADLASSKDIAKIILDLKGFDGEQKTEEIFKYSLLNKPNSLGWKTAILHAENHPLFKGKIGFLLPDNENSEFDIFVTRSNTAMSLFDAKCAINDNNDFLTIRGIFCFCQEIDLPITILNDKDSWKNLLRNKNIKSGFIKMIDEINVNIKEKINEKIACFNDQSTFWKYYLIKNSDLIKHVDAAKIQAFSNSLTDNPFIFLCNTSNNFSQLSISISNHRNEIVSQLIGNYKFTFIGHKGETYQIENKYFKGWNLHLSKSIVNSTDNNQIKLLLEQEKVIIENKEFEDIKEYSFKNGYDNLFIDLKKDYPEYFV